MVSSPSGQRNRVKVFLLSILAGLLFSVLGLPAMAHVSEQGFVLLLPTNVYITSGVIAVVLTVLALAVIPVSLSLKMFSAYRVATVPNWGKLRIITSLLSLSILIALVLIGIFGERDPLKNPLPLYIWTVWWIGLMVIQGLLGNIWYWINPWSGIYHLLIKLRVRREADVVQGEDSLAVTGSWIAIVLFLLFSSFSLIDPAPDDPDRLAYIVSAYWLFTLMAMLVVGEKKWLQSGEFVTIAMRRFAQLSPIDCKNNAVYAGVPGWSAYAQPSKTISAAIFILVLLGCGSFDGLNETFWWLDQIGINPLEFPGRSAIVTQSLAGFLSSNILLILMFAGCVFLGMRLLGDSVGTGRTTFTHAFSELSIAMLPIAFAYHVAHFLTAFLVNIQYTLAATSDPLSNGADLLNLGTHYVTTGFLNTHHTVELIWLVQAGVIVVGHIVSINLAHGIAVRLFGNSRNAAISQLPLASFMILYTLFGLWLLASPKGA